MDSRARLMDEMLTYRGVTVPVRKVGHTFYANGFVGGMAAGETFTFNGTPYVALDVVPNEWGTVRITARRAGEH